MSREIRCPFCDKVIGNEVQAGIQNLGPLGNVPLVTYKYDYRRASHVYIEGGKRHGKLCKACARDTFIEGLAYRVKFDWHGKATSVSGEYGNLFTTRKAAEAVCDRMCDKSLVPDSVQI